MDVKQVDPGVFYGKDYLHWPFAQDFWGTRNYLAQTQLSGLPDAPYNSTHWRDTEWQALVDEALKTVDEVKRNELVREASVIEYERGGHIVWAFSTLLDAHTEKLQGLVANAWGSATATKWNYNEMYFV